MRVTSQSTSSSSIRALVMRSETMLNKVSFVSDSNGDVITVASRSGGLASCRFRQLTCEVYRVRRTAGESLSG